MRFQILTEDLLEEIGKLSRTEQSFYLFLVQSDEYKGRWLVDSLWPEWFMSFNDLVGHYRTVSPARLDEFLDRAQDGGYKVVFAEEPEEILKDYERLQEPPPFKLNSEREGTINGFYPWQIEGFNKLIRNEDIKGGVFAHATGAGKTTLICAGLLWHSSHGHPYDLALVVVKSNNKADINRKLRSLAGIDSIIIDGTPAKRAKLYGQVENLLAEKKVVVVTNYEKFREDTEQLKSLVKGRDVLVYFDEMPTRLSNRKTQLYKAVKSVLWKQLRSKEKGLDGAVPNAKWMRQYELSATPLENNPEGVFNCVRLLNPSLLGYVEEFHGDYVSYFNPFSRKPERWHNLDKMEAKLEHIVHRVSRDDPEIAKLFPKVIENTQVIDWHPSDRAIYDLLTGKAKDMIEEDFEEANILAMIQIMQMLCDAPSMVGESAKNREKFEERLESDELVFGAPQGSAVSTELMKILRKTPTDDHHTKLQTLKEILLERHPDDKALIFMTWASYGFKPITEKLDEWGVTYVTYEGTQKQADEAKDRFREDPSIRVFLSSDRGADSIDLPQAAVGIHYNLPWTWVRKMQRMRNVRVDSDLPVNYWYTLVMADSIEERKQEIVSQKEGYHKALFDGSALDESVSSRLTKEDLKYILLGD